MKTPREILFGRHQDTMPKLDTIRRSVVLELNRKDAKAQSWAAHLTSLGLNCSNKLWLELIWPCRRIWTGYAVVWLLLFISNFSQRDSSQTVDTNSAPLVMMRLHEQQKLLNELFATRSLPAEAERPKIFLPKPRTEKSEPHCI